MKRKAIELFEGFNAHETLQHLHTADLVIRTLPGEEWTLSCTRHKTLLVDVYTFSGKIAGRHKLLVFSCGRLTEILLKVLYINHPVYNVSLLEKKDSITPASLSAVRRKRTSETLEEYVISRLHSEDILFHLASGDWRLSNSTFGASLNRGFDLFHLAKVETLGTPDARYFVSSTLERILLEFLCQDSTFTPHTAQTNVVTFRKSGKSNETSST